MGRNFFRVPHLCMSRNNQTLNQNLLKIPIEFECQCSNRERRYDLYKLIFDNSKNKNKISLTYLIILGCLNIMFLILHENVKFKNLRS